VGLTIKGQGSSPTGLSAAVLSPSVSAPKAIPKGWKLTFNASFAGTKLNTKIWSTCYYWASDGGCTNNPNLEYEWYLPSQATVSDGALHLVAQRTPTKGIASNGTPKTYSCRSGMVTTAPSFNFKYGVVQITAHIPYNTGLWPALWLASTNHQLPAEIDILEHWHTDSFVDVFLHPLGADQIGGPVTTPKNLSAGWHTFRLYWTKNLLIWYIDGVQVYSVTTDVPQLDMYLIANLADDRNGPTSCTGTMMIKSVQVWQP